MSLVKAIGLLGASGEPLDPENPRLSFAVGQRISDLEVRQTLLGMRSEADRIQYLAGIIPAWVEKQKIVEHVRYVAPRNGHSDHLKRDS